VEVPNTAADSYDLDATPATDENGISYALVFDSPEDYAAWCERHPEEAAKLVDGHEESRRRWEAWRAAGNEGLPPGYIRARDYFRQRGV